MHALFIWGMALFARVSTALPRVKLKADKDMPGKKNPQGVRLRGGNGYVVA